MKLTPQYRALRARPLWRLLASDNAPLVLAMLRGSLYEQERTLPASVLLEKVRRDLEELRASGEDLPQTPQAYIATWLSEGYLSRSFPPGAGEEEYELTSDAVDAIRLVAGMERTQFAANESRLSMVLSAMSRLAEETDTDKFRRLDRLNAEMDRIQKEIDDINAGQYRVLPRETALEQTREIIRISDELTADFRKVRDEFEHLNRDLREKIMDTEGSRGTVLDSLFAGIDLISESDAGRTFTAFWRLLTDPEQSALLEESLDSILSRDFASALTPQERRYLLRLPHILLEQGGRVHDVLQNFARSLRNFVQSREYLEHQRIHRLLADAQKTAIVLRDSVRAAESLNYLLTLTGSRIRSISQWTLYDPNLSARPGKMEEGELPAIDLETIGDLVAKSEIDFRTLEENIRSVMKTVSRPSVADVLEPFPAVQGLGSVVGLMALGGKWGLRTLETERVNWTGEDGKKRSARIPKIYFLREKLDGIE